MKYFNKSIACMLMMIIILAGCRNSSQKTSTEQVKETSKVTITDTVGRKVEVPTKINKIGDGWPAHNEVLPILGVGDKIVATVLSQKEKPWLYKVNPQMNNAVVAFKNKGDTNIEELVKAKPDVVFLSSTDKNVEKISSVGIPVVQVEFADFKSLKECFVLTGTILGDEAKKKAERYNSYLDEKIKTITEITSKIPTESKPKILHIASQSPLTVDGKETIIDSWIDVAGGVNAAAEISGNQKEVSMEQILKWNPDIIIIGNSARTMKDVISADSNWRNINAVKQGKVIINPDGAFSWDRYGAEVALQKL